MVKLNVNLKLLTDPAGCEVRAGPVVRLGAGRVLHGLAVAPLQPEQPSGQGETLLRELSIHSHLLQAGLALVVDAAPEGHDVP